MGKSRYRVWIFIRDIICSKCVVFKEHMKIKWDIRPKYDGLWLYGVDITLFGLGLRIQFYNWRQL